MPAFRPVSRSRTWMHTHIHTYAPFSARNSTICLPAAVTESTKPTPPMTGVGVCVSLFVSLFIVSLYDEARAMMALWSRCGSPKICHVRVSVRVRVHARAR